MTGRRCIRVLARRRPSFIAAAAAAQPHPERGANKVPPPAEAPPPAVAPEPSVTPADLDELRSEMKQQGQAAQNRIEADEARHRAPAAAAAGPKRRARQEADAARPGGAEEARAPTRNTPLVHAGRFNVSLCGFRAGRRDGVEPALARSAQPGDGRSAQPDALQHQAARACAPQVDYRVVGGAVEFDGNTNNGYQARIIGAEAYLVWRNPDSPVPWLELTAGSMKIPFGFEVQQRDTDRLFLERSTLEKALFLGEYDLGARVFGGWRFFRYSLAAMNGDPIGEKAFPGRDPNQSKDFIGRVGIETRIEHWLGLAGDVSGICGAGLPHGHARDQELRWSGATPTRTARCSSTRSRCCRRRRRRRRRTSPAGRSAAMCASPFDYAAARPARGLRRAHLRRQPRSRAASSPIRWSPRATCASSAGTSRRRRS